MTRSVRLRPRARRDLREIWKYSAGQWGVNGADGSVRRLLARIDTLATSGRRARPADHLYPGLFQMKVASHLIFFLIDDGEIDVVRLLHERMDAAARLAEDLAPNP